MAANTMPVLFGVLREQRRAVVLWCVALAALSAMYIGLYPSIGNSGLEAVIDNLPEQLSTALGYDRLGTAAGWVTSTVYGLIGPLLLLVFAITTGSRLIAGDEESGDLELEATSPVTRQRIFIERLLALWISTMLIVAVIMVVSYGLVLALAMNITVGNIIAASTGLYLLVIGMGTVALAVGAATGRRAVALGGAATLAVAAYVFDALGPVVGVDWMTAISPFSWYLDNEPLTNGFDLLGLTLLALVPIVAATIGFYRFQRRDLMT